MEIEDYCVLWEKNLGTLESRIQYYIKNGWVPQGGIAILPTAYTDRFYQAMIKPKPPKKEEHVTI